MFNVLILFHMSPGDHTDLTDLTLTQTPSTSPTSHITYALVSPVIPVSIPAIPVLLFAFACYLFILFSMDSIGCRWSPTSLSLSSWTGDFSLICGLALVVVESVFNPLSLSLHSLVLPYIIFDSSHLISHRFIVATQPELRPPCWPVFPQKNRPR